MNKVLTLLTATISSCFLVTWFVTSSCTAAILFFLSFIDLLDTIFSQKICQNNKLYNVLHNPWELKTSPSLIAQYIYKIGIVKSCMVTSVLLIFIPFCLKSIFSSDISGNIFAILLLCCLIYYLKHTINKDPNCEDLSKQTFVQYIEISSFFVMFAISTVTNLQFLDGLLGLLLICWNIFKVRANLINFFAK